jgi:hypothetical protein
MDALETRRVSRRLMSCPSSVARPLLCRERKESPWTGQMGDLWPLDGNTHIGDGRSDSGDVPPKGGDQRGSGVGASPGTWMVWGQTAWEETRAVGGHGRSAWVLPPSRSTPIRKTDMASRNGEWTRVWAGPPGVSIPCGRTDSEMLEGACSDATKDSKVFMKADRAPDHSSPEFKNRDYFLGLL